MTVLAAQGLALDSPLSTFTLSSTLLGLTELTGDGAAELCGGGRRATQRRIAHEQELRPVAPPVIAQIVVVAPPSEAHEPGRGS
jgi:hypothetical protein